MDHGLGGKPETTRREFIK